MRRVCRLAILLLILTTFARSVLAQSDRLRVEAAAPPPPQRVTASYAGRPGNGGFFYWVVANYPIGSSALGGPAQVRNTASALSPTNNVTVAWRPQLGASTYDVLRTLTPQFPISGSCTCAVQTGVTATSITDTGGALAAYTITNPATSATGIMRLDNRDGTAPRWIFSPALPLDPVSVEAFGAKCDGVTDDTAAFLAAEADPAPVIFVPNPNNADCVVTSTWNATKRYAGPGRIVRAGTNLARDYTQLVTRPVATPDFNLEFLGDTSFIDGRNFIISASVDRVTGPQTYFQPELYPLVKVNDVFAGYSRTSAVVNATSSIGTATIFVNNTDDFSVNDTIFVKMTAITPSGDQYTVTGKTATSLSVTPNLVQTYVAGDLVGLGQRTFSTNDYEEINAWEGGDHYPFFGSAICRKSPDPGQAHPFFNQTCGIFGGRSQPVATLGSQVYLQTYENQISDLGEDVFAISEVVNFTRNNDGTKPVTSATAGNPTIFTTTSDHDLVDGWGITITGATGDWAAINGSYNIDSTSATTFTIPFDSTGFLGAFDGTVTNAFNQWHGTLYSSVGSAYADAAFIAKGRWRSGLDVSQITLDSDATGIRMAGNQRIDFNATRVQVAGDTRQFWGNTPSGEYLRYGSTSGNFEVFNNSALSLSVNDTESFVPGRFGVGLTAAPSFQLEVDSGVHDTQTIVARGTTTSATGFASLGTFSGNGYVSAGDTAANNRDLILRAAASGVETEYLRIVGTSGNVQMSGSGVLQVNSVVLASLPAALNGSIIYCSDCLKGSDPCTGASTGAMAMRVNGGWQCM